LESICISTKEEDPVRIANLCMTHTSFQDGSGVYGMILPPVIITALKNQSLIKPSESALRRALELSGQIKPDFFTDRTDYGISHGAGIAIYTIMTLLKNSGAAAASEGNYGGNPNNVDDRDATEYSDAWIRYLMMKTGGGILSTLMKISRTDGLPCPHQCIYVGIKTVLSVVKFNLKMMPKLWKIKCMFYRKSSGCTKEMCPFYPAGIH